MKKPVVQRAMRALKPFAETADFLRFAGMGLAVDDTVELSGERLWTALQEASEAYRELARAGVSP
jgi:hypothetical protein